ncbi:hypothetical protein FM113_01500 [Leucobacter sp. 7(1)]|nr:hypothetical protein FM113_01500 [Leucobacter sp. 7(1)]
MLTHGYPAVDLDGFASAIGIPEISRNDAIEATQYAIWRYTDLDFDASWNWENANSEAAYWHLVEGANAHAGITPSDLAVTASVTAPTGRATPGSLVGPFVVNTNQEAVAVSVDPGFTVTDAMGNPVDLNAVSAGAELFIDLRATKLAGSATLRVSAAGSGATGHIVSVPNAHGGTPTQENHAQSIILVAPSTATTDAQATVEWAAAEGVAPKLGTSLVDAADQDRVLAWNGGTAIDTVAYENLVPGTEVTVVGELMRKSDGSETGLRGAVTFTPEAANGSVDVEFVVPQGYAGQTLVAFERVFVGSAGSGEVIAEHTDIDDPAQTILVAQAPKHAVPSASPATLAQTGSADLPVAATLAGLVLVGGALVLLHRARKLS